MLGISHASIFGAVIFLARTGLPQLPLTAVPKLSWRHTISKPQQTESSALHNLDQTGASAGTEVALQPWMGLGIVQCAVYLPIHFPALTWQDYRAFLLAKENTGTGPLGRVLPRSPYEEKVPGGASIPGSHPHGQTDHLQNTWTFLSNWESVGTMSHWHLLTPHDTL